MCTHVCNCVCVCARLTVNVHSRLPSTSAPALICLCGFFAFVVWICLTGLACCLHLRVL